MILFFFPEKIKKIRHKTPSGSHKHQRFFNGFEITTISSSMISTFFPKNWN